MRLMKVNFSHFQRERGLHRTRELTNMKPHEPFAAEFNEDNAGLVNVELRLIDNVMHGVEARGGSGGAGVQRDGGG